MPRIRRPSKIRHPQAPPTRQRTHAQTGQQSAGFSRADACRRQCGATGHQVLAQQPAVVATLQHIGRNADRFAFDPRGIPCGTTVSRPGRAMAPVMIFTHCPTDRSLPGRPASAVPTILSASASPVRSCAPSKAKTSSRGCRRHADRRDHVPGQYPVKRGKDGVRPDRRDWFHQPR